jgi:SAM-dependent methyltransferase
VNRSELLAGLRADASEQRRTAGPTRVPEPEEARIALRAALAAAALPTEGPIRGDPAALADPTTVDLRSHRPFTGGFVRSVKGAVLRLLANVLQRQGQFNAEACAEVRELKRRSEAARRSLEARLDAAEWRASQASGRLAPAYPTFDYDAFESTFRGTVESQRRSLVRYVPLLCEAGGPVLDLGCGRGELLTLLREAGLPGRGIDLDPRAVATARARGLDVARGDLSEGLHASSDGSLGAVVAMQVIEHLTLRSLRDLLCLARRKLRPGGLLLLETVNVSSGYALAHGWTIDPTHRLRLHPRVLECLVLEAGFGASEILFGGEVASRARIEVESDRSPESTLLGLDWLFAPQDFALLARA